MLQPHPTVSVIVINYNGRQHLTTCFESLLALDYPPDALELILADNASADDSVALVRRRFPSVRIIAHPQNYGFAGGNNRAAEQAGGRYIVFLNNDMRVQPDWLKSLVAALAPAEGIVAASSRLLTWDGGRIDFAGTSLNFYGHAWKVGDGDPDLDRYAQNRPILAPSGGAMIIDRAIFLDVGGFDEDFFAYFEDVDLGWRLWVMGYRVTLAANSVAYHVHQGSWGKVQMAKRLVLYERNAIMGMVKNYDDESLARLLPVALMLLLRRAYLYAAPRLQEAAYRPPNGAGEPPPRVEAPPAPPPSQAYSAAYYWRVAWQTLRAGGARALWRRIRLELARRPLPGGRELAARLVQPALKRHFQPVSPLTVSLLLAGNDIAKELPQLMEKRAFIQARRRRPDAEILKLFGAPFQTNHAAPAYRQSQDSLVELFGITELFPGANHPPEVNDP